MKLSILITLLYTLASLQQNTDIFYVVHIKGEIFNESTKRVLQLQDKLKSTDKLTFKSADSKAVIYSTSKGRFVLSKSTLSQTKKTTAPLSEYIYIIRNVLVPVTSTSHLGTRSLDLKGVEDLEEFFGSNTYAFIGDTYKIRVSASSYPMSGGRYFVYRYSFKGQEYNKRIDNIKDTLVFNKKALYTVKGNSIKVEDAGKAEIYYFEAETSPSKITSITPVFVPENQLKEEIRTMINILKAQDLSNKQTLEKLHEHVEATYGNTNKSIFENWVSDNFDI